MSEATHEQLNALLDELLLIRSSLLPTELMSFTSSDANVDWDALLDAHASGAAVISTEGTSEAPSFSITVTGSHTSFHVVPSSRYPEDRGFAVAVRGDSMSRDEQERWQAEIRASREAFYNDPLYPIYEMISLHLLPKLHEETTALPTSAPILAAPISQLDMPYHALFTSHHLVSPKKRRSLHLWATELSLSGFAKLGHPGLIYCEGSRPNVEDFVQRVKGMQWLALRLRVVEEIDALSDVSGWREVEKVGEVVDEMRKRGRETLVLELGIGSGPAT